jgi:hypothetical protein
MEMNEDSINYKYYHWGPLLTRFQLTEEELNKVRLLSQNTGESVAERLAGKIKHQLKVKDEETSQIWTDILRKYFEVYVYMAFTEWHEVPRGPRPHPWMEPEKIRLCSPLWINHMYANDFNPIHTHTGTISFVLYTQIPDNMYYDPEMENNKASSSPSGSIEFRFGTADGMSDLRPIVHHNVCPEVGELYVFPSYLPHIVAPFKCDGVRKSIAGNVVYE